MEHPRWIEVRVKLRAQTSRTIQLVLEQALANHFSLFLQTLQQDLSSASQLIDLLSPWTAFQYSAFFDPVFP